MDILKAEIAKKRKQLEENALIVSIQFLKRRCIATFFFNRTKRRNFSKEATCKRLKMKSI